MEHVLVEQWNRDGRTVKHLMSEQWNRVGRIVEHMILEYLMMEQENRDG